MQPRFFLVIFTLTYYYYYATQEIIKKGAYVPVFNAHGLIHEELTAFTLSAKYCA